jgi:hypothetical protein
MAGCRLFLTFEGVDCAFYAWLNGSFLGFSKDSRLPAEFEVTGLLLPGANRLAVQVRARSAAPAGRLCLVRWRLAGRRTRAPAAALHARQQRPALPARRPIDPPRRPRRRRRRRPTPRAGHALV